MKKLKLYILLLTSGFCWHGSYRCLSAEPAELPAQPRTPPGASESISQQLASGVLAENADLNLIEAIKNYQRAIEEFEAGRKPAALAIFQLGAAYLKQGKTEEAIKQFARISKEFPDLVELTARSNVALTSALKQYPNSGGAKSTGSETLDPSLMANSLLVSKEEMLILRRQVEEGKGTREELNKTQRELQKVQTDLAALEEKLRAIDPTNELLTSQRSGRRMGQVLFYGKGARNSFVSIPPGEKKSLLEAIMQAGYNEFANLKKVKLERMNRETGKFEAKIINVDEIQRDSNKDFPLQDEDRIEIPERTISF